ncbi:immunoglobulin mu Fc receptor [Macrotis lagotis]|uniref:immunoglobulin mu Fc receptor n=1 Tax=Macrotis lagotis TaxID=92651 RepID=UPI003D69D7E7
MGCVSALSILSKGWDGIFSCKGIMDVFLWIVFFLPISKALMPFREMELFGALGGSINIWCPMKGSSERYYLCRKTESKLCSTIVSTTSFVAEDYKGRVSLKLLPEEKVFLVEMRKLTEKDNGNYACGMGKRTDRGKTLKVVLTIFDDYDPFWEETDFYEFPPPWLQRPDEFLSSLPTTQVSTTLMPLREIKLFGALGGSINIRCPMKRSSERYYLCRETESKLCSTVVSTSFVAEDYKGRVSLKLLPEEKVFLVEMRKLTEKDNGNYACGMGKRTDRGKTLKVVLTIFDDYGPFGEEFDFYEHLPPPWFRIPDEDPSFLSTTQAPSTSAPRTQPRQTQPPLESSPTNPFLPQRTTLVAPVSSQTSLSSVVKTLLLSRLLKPSTVSYSHHTKLRGESASYFSSSVKKDGGFHMLILSTLGILFMILLGMVLGRSLQKRRALSKRINRLTMRMGALEASQRVHPHLHRSHQRRPHRPVPNRLRSQLNIYSACPRQIQTPDHNGEQTSTRNPEIAEPSTTTQVSKIVQLQAPVPMKNENMNTYHLCLAEPEDSDSHDYINVSCSSQLPSCLQP